MENLQTMSGLARGRLPIARQGWPFILGSTEQAISPSQGGRRRGSTGKHKIAART